jgi:hypothetical protein
MGFELKDNVTSGVDEELSRIFTANPTSVTPGSNSAIDLGSSSLKWDNVYANTFIGAITGNADSATKIQVTQRDTDATHYLTFVSNDPDGSYEDLYGDDNTDYDSIFWDTTESAIRLKTSATDTTIGMAFPAFRVNVNPGEKFKISLQIKSDTTSSTGVYIRAYEYDSELPTGKTHVSNSATNSVVQEDTRRNTTVSYENQPGNTDWQTINFDYTPTSSAVWTSIVVLNWSGLGTNALWVRDLKRETIISEITNIGLAANLDGGAAGSLPYQSATDTTTFLAEPNANDKILSYNNSTNAPIWIDKSSAGVDNYVDSVSFSSGTLTLGRTGSLADLTASINLSDIGSNTFVNLSDTPANYTSAAGKVVKVNSSGNALEFVDSSTAGKTYTLTAVDSGNNVILRLGDGTTNDDVLITAGSNIIINPVAAGGFTIAADVSVNSVLTGTIHMWGGSVASIPPGYQLCNGAAALTSELQAITGATVPDLRDRFIVGAGSGYAVGATGGSANAVVVSHTHGVSHNHGVSHTHGMSHTHGSGSLSGSTSNPGNHAHSYTRPNGRTGVDGSPNQANPFDDTTGAATGGAGGHTHSVSISGSTGSSSISNTGSSSISNTGAASNGVSGTNANLPPYYALVYMIKT